MSFLDTLFGRSPKNEQVSRLTGGQDDLLNFIIQQAMGGQGGFGFDEDFFQQNFADPAMRQFEQRTAPGIQQKFIGAGAGRGSNVNDALTRAGADVQGGLDKQRAGLLNQALDRQLQAAGLGLGTQSFGIEQDPGTTGLFSDIFSGLGSGIGSGAGKEIGSSLGKGVSSGVRDIFKNFGFRR